MMSVDAIIAAGNKSHLTKEEIDIRKQQEEELKKLNSDKVKPPTWLSKVAKKIFKDIASELQTIELLKNIDNYGLAVLSDAISKYIECTIQMHNEELMIEYTNKNGNTNVIENPLIRTQIKYAEVVRKYSSDFGLSPAARLKIIQQNTPELSEEEEDFRRKFADV